MLVLICIRQQPKFALMVQVPCPGVRGAAGQGTRKGVTGRGGCRPRGTKVRDEGHAPDRRCGTAGASWHATTKPSIHHGLCLIHPAPLHRRDDSCPREASHAPREVACHGNWLNEAEASLTPGEESADGRVGTRIVPKA
jgi:hypothetical protein